MCIICVQPTKLLVTKEVLQRCWNNNRNGGGFAYTDGTKVLTFKELDSFEKYYSAFTEALAKNPDSPFIHHFRISTHGKIDKTNCHPFLVNKKLGFAHNGIISNASYSTNYSDTYMFNEEILKNLPSNFLSNPALIKLIEGFIGYGSKLAFLDANGNYSIINEKAGVWDEGIWYSNGGYKAYNYMDYGGRHISGANKPKGTKNAAKPTFKSISDTTSSKSTKSYKFDKGSGVVQELGWDKELKNSSLDYTDRINAKYGSQLSHHCVVCDSELTTYSEKQQCYCNPCAERFNANDGVF